MIGPSVRIGKNCKIQNNVSLYKGIILEDNVFCGPSCVFTNVKTPRAFIDRSDEFIETFVRKGASIGHDAYSLLSGFNRVFPSNVPARRGKVTIGGLVRMVEERKLEKQLQIKRRQEEARQKKEKRKTELWEQQKRANNFIRKKNDQN